MSNSAGVNAYMHVDGFDGYMRDAFDKKAVRRGMRRVGRLVEGKAKDKLRSAAGKGNYPKSRSGRIVRSIKVRVSRSGFLVRVAPEKVAGMDDFYPAFLHYGVTGKARRRDGRSQTKDGNWRIRPRANYMADTLQETTGEIKSLLATALADALR